MTKVHALLDAYAQAVYQKDIDQLLKLYTEDVVVYDALNQWHYHGKQDWRRGLTEWFQELEEDRYRVTFSQVETEFDNTIAGLHAIVLYEGISPDTNYHLQTRLTMFLKRVGDDWQICHEHTSLPVHKTGGTTVTAT